MVIYSGGTEQKGVGGRERKLMDMGKYGNFGGDGDG